MKGIRIGRAVLVSALVLLFAASAAPAFAQTGGVKGKVVDAKNQAVQNAKVTIQAAETNRKFETKTNSRGEFTQIGLPPGNYTVTVDSSGFTQTQDVRVGMDTREVNFALKPGDANADAKKEDARIAGIQAKFTEGATLANAGKFDEAVAKFNEVLVDAPKCSECYVALGSVYTRKQEWDKAEEAYKKAIEVKADSADAYTGLANIYNAQKKFKEAQAASAEAAKYAGAAGAGGDADSLYNQGVIAWNANDFAKAQELFASAVKANDKHAEAHFMLGQANLNLGKLPEAAKEFETYMKLAPSGPNAEKAKTFYESLKQYIK